MALRSSDSTTCCHVWTFGSEMPTHPYIAFLGLYIPADIKEVNGLKSRETALIEQEARVFLYAAAYRLGLE